MQCIADFHAAELNAADKMRSWGITGAVATTGGDDGGVDVQSSRALAQVKCRGGAAGRPDLQRLVGAASGSGITTLMFLGASAYSKQAVQYADQVGVALFIYDPVGKVEASNKVATAFIRANDMDVNVSFKQMTWLPTLSPRDLMFVALVTGGLLGVGVLFALLAL